MTFHSIIELGVVAAMASVLCTIGLASLEAVRAEARADYSHSQWLDAKEKREEMIRSEKEKACRSVMLNYARTAEYDEEVAEALYQFCLYKTE